MQTLESINVPISLKMAELVCSDLDSNHDGYL